MSPAGNEQRMMKNFKVAIVILAVVIFCMHGYGNAAMTTIKAMSKDQIACSMCSSCQNPCQPILSPPILPPPVYSPPPPPPTPSPPPPSSPPQPATNYCPPPPPSPPPADVCPPPPISGSYYPPSSPAAINPLSQSPPNPMMPYFPFYFNSPPPYGNSAISTKPTATATAALLFIGMILIPFSIFHI